jgi:hypothetical protein
VSDPPEELPPVALEPDTLPDPPLRASDCPALVAKEIGLPGVSDLITVYVSIGNSDDKLTQKQWSCFWELVASAVREDSEQVYGDWMSAPVSPCQNACIAFCIERHLVSVLKAELRSLAALYGQDSIAWAEAGTEFLKPAQPGERSGPEKIADAIRSARGGPAPAPIRGFA